MLWKGRTRAGRELETEIGSPLHCARAVTLGKSPNFPGKMGISGPALALRTAVRTRNEVIHQGILKTRGNCRNVPDCFEVTPDCDLGKARLLQALCHCEASQCLPTRRDSVTAARVSE